MLRRISVLKLTSCSRARSICMASRRLVTPYAGTRHASSYTLPLSVYDRADFVGRSCLLWQDGRRHYKNGRCAPNCPSSRFLPLSTPIMRFNLSTLTTVSAFLTSASAAPPGYGGGSTSSTVNTTTCNGKTYVYQELAGYGFIPSDATDKYGDTIGEWKRKSWERTHLTELSRWHW
jgi:hypothetical protein